MYAFVMAALALAGGNMSATVASPLFPLYVLQWGLSPSLVTVIYVVYMVGVLAAFLFLGRLSDWIGPLRALRLGMVGAMLGLALSIAAPGMSVLLVARVLIGVASGMISTAGTLAMIRFEPRALRGRAPLAASFTTMMGFASGLLASGLVAQFAPWPLVLPYLLLIVFLALLLVGLAKVPEPAPALGVRFSAVPRLTLPRRDARQVFLVGAFSMFTAYSTFGMMTALAPSFLGEFLPWHGPAVSGGALALILFCSSFIQLTARGMAPGKSVRAAMAVLLPGMVLLAAALLWHGAVLFALADLAIGIGHGLAFMSGMAMVARVTTERDRAGVLSTFLIICYLGPIAPVLGVGWLADHMGLARAVMAFCAAVAVMTVSLYELGRRAYRGQAR